VFLTIRVPQSAMVTGEPAGIRTQDTRLKRAVLYQLSYRPAHAVFFKEAYISKELCRRQ
jgi:hypothetical protein